MRGVSKSADADVLVVGLGPAGACAARAAASAGLRVIGIDRKAEAGIPVQCAEFVPAMIGQNVAALGKSAVQSIHGMSTFIEAEPPHRKEPFPGAMIDRAAFDAALVEEARTAGAWIWHGLSLRSVEPNGTARLSDGSALTARVMVGADGPHSRVGAAIGRVNTEICETRQITVPLTEPFAETDIFFSQRLPGGYAWLFPKGEVANLGLGAGPELRARFKPLLDSLHARLVEQGRVGAGVLGYTGGAIPAGGMLHPVGRLGGTLVLLAGDAAGLANPITGAGISAAVVSGRLAGEAAARHVALDADADTEAGSNYAEELEDLFKASLDRALARRRALLATHARQGYLTSSDFQRAWIAFPQYWAA